MTLLKTFVTHLMKMTFQIKINQKLQKCVNYEQNHREFVFLHCQIILIDKLECFKQYWDCYDFQNHMLHITQYLSQSDIFSIQGSIFILISQFEYKKEKRK